MPSAGTAVGAGVSLLSGKKASDDSSKSRSLQRDQLGIMAERDEFNREQIEKMNKWARKDRADVLGRRDRARALYDPLEEGLIDLAAAGPDYATAEARSDADVAQAYGLMRDQERRRQHRYGVNPSSGRTSAMERRIGNEEALARVYGRNRARMQEDDKDWSRRMAALGSGNIRNANASTQLAQLGAPGQVGVLQDMSASYGANAAGAASFGGKMLADTLSGEFGSTSFKPQTSGTGGIDMTGNWMDPYSEDAVN